MSATSRYGSLRGNLEERLEVIVARLEAASRRCRALRLEPGEQESPAGDPVHRLEEIEGTLEALEERLRKIETDLRDKESPPASFGTSNEFSTGHHFPGLG
jgi:chromosome segregation ATPase